MLAAQVHAKDVSGAIKAWENIGTGMLGEWKGVHQQATAAQLSVPGTASFQYPQGPNGWYNKGFRKEHDGTHDWRSYYGISMEVWVSGKNSPVELDITLFTPPPALRAEYLPQAKASVTIRNGGWQKVLLPWTAFDIPAHQQAMLKFIQKITLESKETTGGKTSLLIRNIRLIKAPQLAFSTAVQGKSLTAGDTARYKVTVTNCTDAVQDVNLHFLPRRFTVMQASVSPRKIQLLPGASSDCIVSVAIPAAIATGGHEQQQLTATLGSGAIDNTLDLVTACAVPHPYVLHTAARWEEVKQKTKAYDWAKKSADKYVADATAWTVPQTAGAAGIKPEPGRHDFVYYDRDFIQAQNAAIAWQLGRNSALAEKVALFLNRLADEQTGYPSTFAGTNNDGPQEGEDFQRAAIAYDAILDAGVLTKAQQEKIEHTFYLYMETYETDFTVGNIGNWSTSESTAALMEALSMGNLAAAERYIYGPAGFTDYLSKGVMDDGWWWEVSTGYNLWVAMELTQAALACQPWGIDLVHLEVPASYSPYAIITPWALNPPYGVSFEKWGPVRDNTRSIKKFWDALPKVTDYRGIAFGMNDGHEEVIGGQRMELAYYVYRDPAFATIIKLSNQRDLLYGVPVLPDSTPALFRNSAYAENIGYSLLRSQTPDRDIKDQIQAVLKIGTQGGYHGHFDRVSLDNLTRYGQSFWNPETIWWGYPNFMYKFYVQTSVNHNMVVVDQQQQEAVPSSQILFHSGKMMQVAAQETNARWSDPPYLGMQYAPGESPADQMKKNHQSLPVAADRAYGDLGTYSERILQRRLMIVTDNYVVLADYLKGKEAHTFDNLFQMKAITGLTAGGTSLQPVRHEGQYSRDIRKAAQCITDVDWYYADKPVKAQFHFTYGPGADNSGTLQYFNEPGTLKIDMHNVWPQQQELMTAMPAENHDCSQWVHYKITGDGKTLSEGETGTWILGQQAIDIPVQGVETLSLELTTKDAKKKALFWANARITDANGKELSLIELPGTTNTEIPVTAGKDYYGGPIKIAGEISATAWPGQPLDPTKESISRISLKGKQAVRFKVILGGDYPFGPEGERRKIFASRVTGKEARFLTVLEPYKAESLIESTEAMSADRLRVKLKDGRVQEIQITQLDTPDKKPEVTIRELRNGQVIRNESTTSL